MLSFYNFNDKSNINRDKNHNDIFSKQGRTFTKLQRFSEEKEINIINDSCSLSDSNSKKQNNFKEGFGNLENTFDNQTFDPPSLDYINYYKTQSENETPHTSFTINGVENNVHFIKKLKNLGCIITDDLTKDAKIEIRIKKAWSQNGNSSSFLREQRCQ